MDPFLSEWVLSLSRPGDFTLDLGAHVGYYTLLLARRVGPHGRVLAFEPDAANFALLSENVAANGYRNVELFNLAVTDRTGPTSLHRSPDNAGDHRTWASPTEARESVPARSVALDDLFGPHGPWVNLIKMDVQGSEAAAVAGMRRLLVRQPHLYLVTEFWPRGLVGAGADPAAYLAGLTGLGFRLHVIDEVRRLVARAEPADIFARVAPGSDQFLDLLAVKS
ncbi:MAG TPA: FkbM family methyltransferase [Gemmataceae bacterium]|nr:FkbM family methyltransferase [Gemmataceae bacterium]